MEAIMGTLAIQVMHTGELAALRADTVVPITPNAFHLNAETL